MMGQRVQSIPWMTLGLGTVVALVFAASITPAAVAFVPARALAGETWRTLSGHFVHLSTDHLVWNLLTFVVLGAIAERRQRSSFLACLLGSALIIPWAVHVVDPGLDLYAGMSGIDCALFALLATSMLRQQWSEQSRGRRAIQVLMLTSLVAKLIYEAATGDALFLTENAAFEVVPSAHLFGACVGAAAAYLPTPSRRALPGCSMKPIKELASAT